MRLLLWRRRRETQPDDALRQRAPRMRHGFSHADPEFMVARRGRGALVQRFLAIMAKANNPGMRRYLGSTIRQLTGQHGEHYWSTVLIDDHGHHREFLVTADGRHGWGDEIGYSDRPRSDEDEISPHLLHKALGDILQRHNLDWESPAAESIVEDVPLSAPARRAQTLTPLQELHRRELRYGAMMGLRIILLITAVILVAVDVPYAGWWAVIAMAGALLLPWLAVMVANERFRPGPPRARA